jgi:hypothetical protein
MVPMPKISQANNDLNYNNVMKNSENETQTTLAHCTNREFGKPL